MERQRIYEVLMGTCLGKVYLEGERDWRITFRLIIRR
jgi:hypothetical protein